MFKDVLDNFKDIGNEIKKLPREIIHSDGTDRLPKEIGASLDTAKPDTQSKDVGVNGGEREFLEGTRSVAVSDASCERKIDQQNDTIKRVESGKIALDSTQKKGNYGEMKTDQDLREKGYEFFPLMAAIAHGTDVLVRRCAALLSELPPIRRYEPEPVQRPDPAVLRDRSVTVTRRDGVFVVEGEWLLRVMRGVNFDDEEGLQYFERVLRSAGVIDALVKAGASEGDTVSLYDLEFDFVE